MILKLGMKHLGMELYKVYVNHDPRVTLTFFTPMHLIGEKIGKCHLMVGNLLGMRKWTEDLCS